MSNTFIGPNIEVFGTSFRNLDDFDNLLLIVNERDSRSLVVSGQGTIVLPLGNADNPEEPIIGDSFEIITEPGPVRFLRLAPFPAPTVSLNPSTVNRYAFINGAWTFISSYTR